MEMAKESDRRKVRFRSKVRERRISQGLREELAGIE